MVMKCVLRRRFSLPAIICLTIHSLDPAIYMFPGLFGKSLIDEKDIMSSGGQFGDWALLGFISVVILVGELSFCQR